MYIPKSKRSVTSSTKQKKSELNGLMANKNIDDIRALAKLVNAQSSLISSNEEKASSLSSSLSTKQEKLKLTTNGFYGPSTLINNTLNVPDYSSAPQGLYSETGDSIPITGTIAERSLIDGGVGTLSVPENAFQVGDSFEAVMGGVISNTNNETLRIKIKSGSTILADSGLITLPSTTNKNWYLVIRFTIRRIGAAGAANIITFSQLTYSKDASNSFEGAIFSSVNNTTFDTTIPNTLDITGQWGSTNVLNNIYTQILTLRKVY